MELVRSLTPKTPAMKKLLFLMITFTSTVSLIAQTNPNGLKKFYLDVGTGPASHNGAFAAFGATAILKSNWTASVSYYIFDMDPKHLPSDYEPGYTLIIFIPVPDPMPTADLKAINFTVGRFFQMGRKTWFTTDAGISIASGKTYHFTPQPVEDNGAYFSSNYSSDPKSTTTIGGMIRGDLTWAFCPYAGLNLGAFASFSAIQSPIGAEIKIVAGWLNTKKHSK